MDVPPENALMLCWPHDSHALNILLRAIMRYWKYLADSINRVGIERWFVAVRSSFAVRGNRQLRLFPGWACRGHRGPCCSCVDGRDAPGHDGEREGAQGQDGERGGALAMTEREGGLAMTVREGAPCQDGERGAHGHDGERGAHGQDGWVPTVPASFGYRLWSGKRWRWMARAGAAPVEQKNRGRPDHTVRDLSLLIRYKPLHPDRNLGTPATSCVIASGQGTLHREKQRRGLGRSGNRMPCPSRFLRISR
jgi:hypothetical protein